MPKISVIVPIYKTEAYLRRCVDSILAQTFTDFELILVDDGSPDKCYAICEDYKAKDSRVIVVHKKNGGVSSARNAGLDAVRGEFVTFVDSDDYVKPAYLRELLEKNADFVCQNGDILKEDGTIAFERSIETFHTRDLSVEDVYQMVYNDSLGYTLGKALRLDIIRKNHIRFRENIKFMEDTLFMTEYALKCKSVVVEDIRNYCYILYRDSRSLTSKDKEELLHCSRMAAREICKVLSDAGCSNTDTLYHHRVDPSYLAYFNSKIRFSPSGLRNNIRILTKTSRDPDWREHCSHYKTCYFPKHLQQAMMHQNVVSIAVLGTLYTFGPALDRVKSAARALHRKRLITDKETE